MREDGGYDKIVEAIWCEKLGENVDSHIQANMVLIMIKKTWVYMKLAVLQNSSMVSLIGINRYEFTWVRKMVKDILEDRRPAKL